MSEPAYEDTEIRIWGTGEVIRTVHRCLHGRAVPVESIVDGEVLAHLCPDCDEQLPA